MKEVKKNLQMAQTTQDASFGPVFIVIAFRSRGWWWWWCGCGCCRCRRHRFDLIVTFWGVVVDEVVAGGM
jgi:hypothetical protein